MVVEKTEERTMDCKECLGSRLGLLVSLSEQWIVDYHFTHDAESITMALSSHRVVSQYEQDITTSISQCSLFLVICALQPFLHIPIQLHTKPN